MADGFKSREPGEERQRVFLHCAAGFTRSSEECLVESSSASMRDALDRRPVIDNWTWILSCRNKTHHDKSDKAPC